MSHTPGPWCLGSSDREVCDLAVCTEYPSPLDGATIARLVSKKGAEYQNAKLIAAAPRLLKTLQDAVDRQAYRPGSGPEWWENARAAITEATGAQT